MLFEYVPAPVRLRLSRNADSSSSIGLTRSGDAGPFASAARTTASCTASPLAFSSSRSLALSLYLSVIPHSVLCAFVEARLQSPKAAPAPPQATSPRAAAAPTPPPPRTQQLPQPHAAPRCDTACLGSPLLLLIDDSQRLLAGPSSPGTRPHSRGPASRRARPRSDSGWPRAGTASAAPAGSPGAPATPAHGVCPTSPSASCCAEAASRCTDQATPSPEGAARGCCGREPPLEPPSPDSARSASVSPLSLISAGILDTRQV
jgi:hypothetical protein